MRCVFLNLSYFSRVALGKPRQLEGQTFGRLLVLRREGTLRGRGFWRCRCTCGKDRLVRTENLTGGVINSCKKCNSLKINRLAKDELRSWDGMLQRCKNPKSPNWARYGGRGITVCERWQHFENFLSDMGPRPSREYSIDRIDNDGMYEPANCRWATDVEQARNTNRNVWIEFDGKRQLLVEFAEEYGLTRRLLAKRLHNGWPLDKALTQRARKRVPKSK